MPTQKKQAAGRNSAQQLLQKIHNGNAADGVSERAHMIADIDQLVRICQELIGNVASSTGQTLNDPQFKALLTPTDVEHLIPLAGGLMRDSQTYQTRLSDIANRITEFKQIEDWPDALALGLAISQDLATWQESYVNVVLPIKDNIDSTISAIIANAKKETPDGKQ